VRLDLGALSVAGVLCSDAAVEKQVFQSKLGLKRNAILIANEQPTKSMLTT
jgi:hypothetical protein